MSGNIPPQQHVSQHPLESPGLVRILAQSGRVPWKDMRNLALTNKAMFRLAHQEWRRHCAKTAPFNSPRNPIGYFIEADRPRELDDVLGLGEFDSDRACPNGLIMHHGGGRTGVHRLMSMCIAHDSPRCFRLLMTWADDPAIPFSYDPEHVYGMAQAALRQRKTLRCLISLLDADADRERGGTPRRLPPPEPLYQRLLGSLVVSPTVVAWLARRLPPETDYLPALVSQFCNKTAQPATIEALADLVPRERLGAALPPPHPSLTPTTALASAAAVLHTPAIRLLLRRGARPFACRSGGGGGGGGGGERAVVESAGYNPLFVALAQPLPRRPTLLEELSPADSSSPGSSSDDDGASSSSSSSNSSSNNRNRNRKRNNSEGSSSRARLRLERRRLVRWHARVRACASRLRVAVSYLLAANEAGVDGGDDDNNNDNDNDNDNDNNDIAAQDQQHIRQQKRNTRTGEWERNPRFAFREEVSTELLDHAALVYVHTLRAWLLQNLPWLLSSSSSSSSSFHSTAPPSTAGSARHPDLLDPHHLLTPAEPGRSTAWSASAVGAIDFGRCAQVGDGGGAAAEDRLDLPRPEHHLALTWRAGLDGPAVRDALLERRGVWLVDDLLEVWALLATPTTARLAARFLRWRDGPGGSGNLAGVSSSDALWALLVAEERKAPRVRTARSERQAVPKTPAPE